ncbi:MAG: hypothetical protein KAT00_08620 [Planctomycetes bacterium]|nr:hypothetical protein [Planctomycetota bacterium]
MTPKQRLWRRLRQTKTGGGSLFDRYSSFFMPPEGPNMSLTATIYIEPSRFSQGRKNAANV